MSKSRKELVREYKETPRVMGVGRVHNMKADRSLIVAGRDLPSLLNRHLAQLRLGAHRNRRLQQDWSELGADAFAFETLDTLAPPADDPGYDPADDLRVLEALWFEKLSPIEPNGYHPPPRRT
jgi:hypothetical protein